ncbi:hypothetical protein J2Y88_002670 [Pseudomonas chlororaphis]|nr:hypothetical protein [Pseudomonas chlororaphis]MCP1593289.1 hypothetical protein [Pseudomonas chlororaphis]
MLRDARVLRDEARALVAKEINPHRDRKQKRAAVRLADENTFKAVFVKWLAHRGLTYEEGRQTTQSMIPRIFDNDVLPMLGHRSIYEVKRIDLLEVIGNIERRKALSVAEKVRGWFNQCSAIRWWSCPALSRTLPPTWMWWLCQAIEVVRYLLEQLKPAQRYLLRSDWGIKARIWK